MKSCFKASKKSSLSNSRSNDRKRNTGRSSRKKRKGVRFAALDTMKQTISLCRMTQEEIKNTWIQEDEATAIRKKCLRIVSKVEQSGTARVNGNSKKQYCIRGLEKYLGRKHTIRRASVQYIVEEYKQYNEQGYVNENEIAKLYKNISMENQIQAQQFAIMDRKEVERYIARC